MDNKLFRAHVMFSCMASVAFFTMDTSFFSIAGVTDDFAIDNLSVSLLLPLLDDVPTFIDEEEESTVSLFLNPPGVVEK
jgi:hypothetical protein